MKNFTLLERIKYWFDNLMSKGPHMMILLLGFLSLIIILFSGLVIWYLKIAPESQEPLGFIESIWQSLLRALDSGTMGGDVGWPFRFVSFLVTLGGIFVLSILIGVLGTTIEEKLNNLRKGKSFVIEKEHTLILGYSSKIFTIISELVIANENVKNPRIVILADKDKVEMEDEIKNKISDLKNTKIICRSGVPYDFSDLEIVNPQQSKSILILTPDEEENADSLTIKTILAITNNPNRRPSPYHIVAEMKDIANYEVAKMVGKDEAEILFVDDIIAKIIVQTSRQSGLSIVYTELFDFDGVEIYIQSENKLIGKSYGEALSVYEDSSLVGIKQMDGSVKLNPDMDYVIKEDDMAIVISEDDSTIVISDNDKNNFDENLILNVNHNQINTENILLLGWNSIASTIITEIDKYVGPNSKIVVVSSFEKYEEEVNELRSNLQNCTLDFQLNDTTNRKVIEKLNITSFDSVQILCYKEEMDIQDADAATLITLLHIRKILDDESKDIKVVSQMLDAKNRALASITKADDFIVSDKLISLLMSQVSENKFLMKVFESLFEAEGSEIYLKPVTEYVSHDSPVDFYTIIESARRKGHSAFGYRLEHLAEDSSAAFGIQVNPNKSTKIQFNANDKIIVLAEN
ncbi:MAG: potassium transporter TrkA [Chitinophagia bacterium]|nr:potassium transporter TrkA [Chitinophagia bacterium]